METATAKVGTQKDVHTIINDKIIELLNKGIVPWRTPWTGGVPHNLISGNPYQGINLLLLSCLGYERNFFLSEKQLKENGASILAGERPHMVAFWNYNDESSVEIKEAPRLSYYNVYNVAQCIIPEERFNGVQQILWSIDEVVADMSHCPEIINKESTAYYDVIEDYINIPKPNFFKNGNDLTSTLFHQLIHCTGHHTRLDRRGLVQMCEYGYTGISQEDIIADIGGKYLEALTGISCVGEFTTEYLEACKAKLQADKYFIFAVSRQAQLAIDFILSKDENEAQNPTE